jgi:hypothetical protein
MVEVQQPPHALLASIVTVLLMPETRARDLSDADAG